MRRRQQKKVSINLNIHRNQPIFTEQNSLSKEERDNNILKVWKTDAIKNDRPPWAPKPHHTTRYDENQITYLAKIKALAQISDQIYNVRLRCFLMCL